jgi:hypothetical protein
MRLGEIGWEVVCVSDRESKGWRVADVDDCGADALS